jgi:hypothetical protein
MADQLQHIHEEQDNLIMHNSYMLCGFKYRLTDLSSLLIILADAEQEEVEWT